MGLPARKIELESDGRIQEACLSLDGERLIFILEDGEGYSLERRRLSFDDGTPVTSIQILSHRHAVSIRQASGSQYTMPSNSIKHYAQGGKRKKSTIGPVLKSLRSKAGMTQEALARKAAMSRMQLSRLEKNQSAPSLETLLNLCRILRVSPHRMIG